MKTLILAAAFAVGFAGFASAAEGQTQKVPAPAVKAHKMSDSDMDKVTAGDLVSISNFNPGGHSVYRSQYTPQGTVRICINCN